MLTALRTAVRHYLGTDTIPRMENTMAKAVEQLTELKTQFTAFTSDVDAKLDQLNALTGDFTPDAQEVFDSLKAAVTEAASKVGDADGSDTPPVPADGTTAGGDQVITNENTQRF